MQPIKPSRLSRLLLGLLLLAGNLQAAGALLVLIRLWWWKTATGAQTPRAGYRAGPR